MTAAYTSQLFYLKQLCAAAADIYTQKCKLGSKKSSQKETDGSVVEKWSDAKL
jgi:hypothetical protein